MDKPEYSDDGQVLQAMGFIKQEQNNFFFSRANQKIHTYELAKEIFIREGNTPEEAIMEAKSFVDAAYKHIFKWEK